MKYVKTFEAFSSKFEIDEIIENTNKYLSNKKFISMINSLPGFIKSYMKKYVDKNSYDLDLISETIQKYNLYDKVKRIYDSGVRDINGFIDGVLGKNLSTVRESFGLAVGVLLVCVVGLVIGILSGSGEVFGSALILCVPVGFAALIAVFLFVASGQTGDSGQQKDNFAKPGTEFSIGDQDYVMNAPKEDLVDEDENTVLQDTLKYQNQSNNFIVLDNGDGTYTVLKKNEDGTYKK
jgi:hypothetical protein